MQLELLDTTPPARAPRFAEVWCSQCGQSFGRGEHGYSACDEHEPLGDANEAAIDRAYGAWKDDGVRL